MSEKQTLVVRPDLQTRESVMLAAGRAQFAVTSVKSGKTVYIKLDAKQRQPEGSARKYAKATLEDATHVFISEKGYGTPRLGTLYPKNDGFYSDAPEGDPHMWALRQIVNLVNGAPASPLCTIEVESACGMCGRKLTDPVSIERGIGPECASKPTGTKILHASTFAPQQSLPGLTPEVTDMIQGILETDEMKLMDAIGDRVGTAIDGGMGAHEAAGYAAPQFPGHEDLVQAIAWTVWDARQKVTA